MTRLLTAIAEDLGFSPSEIVQGVIAALIGIPFVFGLIVGLMFGLAVAS